MIITFYSYKGGTGRTMALANLGFLLTRQQSATRVLMVDWDLEAPGLHRYFRRLLETTFPADTAGETFDAQPGLIDLFVEVAQAISAAPADASETSARNLLEDLSPHRFVLQTDISGLFLLKAGRFDEAYAGRVQQFDWQGLHARSPWIFRALAEYAAEQFDYVLIDSRTGLTDTAGICTSILPDRLAVVFTPNRQSLLGALGVVREATRYRKDSDDLRPLVVLPLVSRVEATEPQLRAAWRFGDPEGQVPGYQPLFEELFRVIYDLPECSLERYFDDVQVQHVPWFAYGEEIGARVEPADRLSLTRSFECFAKYLTAVPWQSQPDVLNVAPGSAAEPGVDEAWRASKRAHAEAALAQLNISGFMEATLVRGGSNRLFSQRRLFDAAKEAQVVGAGWPIGATVNVTGESRPQSADDGLVTEIIDAQTLSYDYWTLRPDGSFYFLRNLEEEDSDYLLVSDRIQRVTELLFYGRRLYSFLGLENTSFLRIWVRYSGLRGRFLAARVPERPEALTRVRGTCTTDSVQSEAIVSMERLGRSVRMPGLQEDLLKLVKQLTRPLFWLFDFYEVPDSEYYDIVAKRLQDWGLTSGVQDQRNERAAEVTF